MKFSFLVLVCIVVFSCKEEDEPQTASTNQSTTVNTDDNDEASETTEQVDEENITNEQATIEQFKIKDTYVANIMTANESITVTTSGTTLGVYNVAESAERVAGTARILGEEGCAYSGTVEILEVSPTLVLDYNIISVCNGQSKEIKGKTNEAAITIGESYLKLGNTYYDFSEHGSIQLAIEDWEDSGYNNKSIRLTHIVNFINTDANWDLVRDYALPNAIRLGIFHKDNSVPLLNRALEGTYDKDIYTFTVAGSKIKNGEVGYEGDLGDDFEIKKEGALYSLEYKGKLKIIENRYTDEGANEDSSIQVGEIAVEFVFSGPAGEFGTIF